MNSQLLSRAALLTAAFAMTLSTTANAQGVGSWLQNAFTNNGSNIQNDISNGSLTAAQGSKLQQWETNLQNKYNQDIANGGTLTPGQARSLGRQQGRLNQILNRDVMRNQYNNGTLGSGLANGWNNNGWNNNGWNNNRWNNNGWNNNRWNNNGWNNANGWNRWNGGSNNWQGGIANGMCGGNGYHHHHHMFNNGGMGGTFSNFLGNNNTGVGNGMFSNGFPGRGIGHAYGRHAHFGF